jgi:hypothetical protein
MIRVTLPVPSDAKCTLLAVDDPHGCASPTALSVYRRPPPLTSFDVLGAVMWDGRPPSNRMLKDPAGRSKRSRC